MSKKVQIQMVTPCTQSWDNMDTIQGGKFCSSCEKKVIDFTLLSDRQVLEIFRKNKHVCGRFTDEQLNKEFQLTAYQPNAFIPAAILCTALATGLAVSSYAAKNTERSVSVTAQDTIRPIETIRCNTVISKELVQSSHDGSAPIVKSVPIMLQGTIGGAAIGVTIKEDNNIRNEWWWLFK
jgi:hypothetical protein